LQDTLEVMGTRDMLLAEYDHEMGTTRRLLERIPDEKLSWKPHSKSMSLGGLGTHIANLPTWGGTILNETSFDLATAPPNLSADGSRDAILRRFHDASTRTRGWMDKTDAEYACIWTLKRGGQEMFSLPRAAAFKSFVINHIIHHRGQMSVYLRLNEVAVPAIYGPTADEG
jgi:uncharacterized damage-inducible protein DinB